MAISGLGVGIAAAGGFLLWSGIRNVTVIDGLRELLQGRVPAEGPQTVANISYAAAVGSVAGTAAGASGAAESVGAAAGAATGSSASVASLGGVRPHVAAAAAELAAAFGIQKMIGKVPGLYDHPKGLAVDFMTRDGRALAEYARANYGRLRITYVIWNRRIWNRSKDGDSRPNWAQWRAYVGVSPHTDHVHISFEAG